VPDGSPADPGPAVRTTTEGAVRTLTLDTPHNRNALSSRLMADLSTALAAAAADPSVRLVVLTGSGTVFSSGADLAERRRPSDEAPGPPGAGLPDVLDAIVEAPVPVLARVNGHVRGGGIGLVAACDLAVAEAGATFAFSEVRVGVAPAIIAVPILAVADRRALVRYALTGEVFGADEAFAMGLLTAAVEPGDLDRWVGGVAEGLLAGAPGAVAATKRLLVDLAGVPWDDALARATALSEELFASPEAAEGIAAFVERRPPGWTPA